MEYLVCTARNLKLSVLNPQDEPIADQNELQVSPLIEMILTTYEKKMEFVDSNLINIKKTNSHRIGLNINAAEALVTHLGEWIKEAKTLQTRLNDGTLTCESEND